ncbi:MULTISPECIES: DUF6880 family protein [Pseudosulfitobacter]|uniref:DUF6880 family protein n=1 Tax=Pseudosulfitobacter pseudonitzschiae TaxID=1402135 RepID=UPI000932DFC3|nr:DUF6880 family protein [Pseudosulfitobacter pseudonitzschiae]
MAGKAPKKVNLVALDPEVLAALLLEVVRGDTARQRRVRMVRPGTLRVAQSCRASRAFDAT